MRMVMAPRVRIYHEDLSASVAILQILPVLSYHCPVYFLQGGLTVEYHVDNRHEVPQRQENDSNKVESEPQVRNPCRVVQQCMVDCRKA